MQNSTKAIITTIAGVVLSLGILVVKFLDNGIISDQLAGLFITGINIIAQGFNLVLINTQQNTIATMQASLPLARSQLQAVNQPQGQNLPSWKRPRT